MFIEEPSFNIKVTLNSDNVSNFYYFLYQTPSPHQVTGLPWGYKRSLESLIYK